MCLYTVMFDFLSLYLFPSDFEAVLFVTATFSNIVSLESVHSWFVCHVNQQKGIVFSSLRVFYVDSRWISSGCYLLCFINLGILTTVMFSCSPSKFCISRKQASNPWELTFSTQRVAASCFWPSTECSAVRKT